MDYVNSRVCEAINRKFEALFRHNGGDYKPHVCIVCDVLLKPKEICYLALDTLESSRQLLIPSFWNEVSSTLKECYTVSHNNSEWLEDLLLSPRAQYIEHRDGRRTDGFTCCRECKQSLGKNVMPMYAIANNYSFGSPPHELLTLTEVERAMLTPVKTYGYCFNYVGGKQKKLQGSLTYYKVKIESIVRTTMHFEVLNLHQNVLVLISGKMTPEQRCLA